MASGDSDKISMKISLEHALKELAEEHERKESDRRAVYLNVYDMLSTNAYTSRFGIGAFHTGVVVYGREFAYGSHPDAHTGVYAVEPRGATGAAGESLQFRESILLGHTRLSEEQVRDIVSSIGKEFSGKDYDILQKNCNHFTAILSWELCRTKLPSWINRLASVGSWMPVVIRNVPHFLFPSSCVPLSHTQSISMVSRQQEENNGSQEATPHTHLSTNN